ncbi:MAG: hypothetical protein CL897_06645 [Dehalococcoidia bacterium]|nr:hypothetical protein [Dehalococcoidia bacterium]HCU99885.1 hypothetical protein [Dehalococcoidia bacterium]
MTEILPTDLCTICTEPIEQHTESYCNACGRVFHLNQREDLPGRDCGTVSLSETHLALVFICNSCGEEASAPTAPTALEAVLDLSEAAMATGLSENELQEQAAAGTISHRRTSGGALLFEREAIQALLHERGPA